ncbi:hypothetical protein GF325_18670 [Candidatus Bathyarchaeota archaeon]|nr:hypothetical protein [Candidatus Bathyarchaeota archaeon]
MARATENFLSPGCTGPAMAWKRKKISDIRWQARGEGEVHTTPNLDPEYQEKIRSRKANMEEMRRLGEYIGREVPRQDMGGSWLFGFTIDKPTGVVHGI